MTVRIASMTLTLEHLRRDRWEARLEWAQGSRRQLIGWTSDADDLVDRVVEEIKSHAPLAVLISATPKGALLYEAFRLELDGPIKVTRQTSRQPTAQ